MTTDELGAGPVDPDAPRGGSYWSMEQPDPERPPRLAWWCNEEGDAAVIDVDDVMFSIEERLGSDVDLAGLSERAITDLCDLASKRAATGTDDWASEGLLPVRLVPMPQHEDPRPGLERLDLAGVFSVHVTANEAERLRAALAAGSPSAPPAENPYRLVPIAAGLPGGHPDALAPATPEYQRRALAAAWDLGYEAAAAAAGSPSPTPPSDGAGCTRKIGCVYLDGHPGACSYAEPEVVFDDEGDFLIDRGGIYGYEMEATIHTDIPSRTQAMAVVGRALRLGFVAAPAGVPAVVSPPSEAPQEGEEGDYNGVAYRDREELLDLIADLSDPDPCSLDHHGYCQTHGWLEEGTCPHARAAALRPAASPSGSPSGKGGE